jgi:hypothetical protein
MRDAFAWVGLGLGLVGAAASAVSGGSAPPAPPALSGLATLENGRVVLSLLPSLGGRVVVFRAASRPNVLDAHWREPFPPPSLDTPFEPWNGHVVWIGPQSAWWTGQDLVPERRQARAMWPPDPFNETARYEVVEKTATHLRMRAPASPLTGLQLEQEIELLSERRARLQVTATNRRDTAVAGDLWPNTRVQPSGTVYVPLAPGSEPRIDDAAKGTVGTYPHRIARGWLSFEPGHRPVPPLDHLRAKAFVRPAEGLIAFFLGGQVFLKRAPLVPTERLHPEETFIELYRGGGSTAADDILELEMHGAYETLGPGASMRFEETWELLDDDGPAGVEGHLAFLDRLGRREGP